MRSAKNKSFNESCGLSRRIFLQSAIVPIATFGLSGQRQVRSDELVSARLENSGPVHVHEKSLPLLTPLYLSQKSYPSQSNSASGLAELIAISRDSWKFSGIELSLPLLLAAAQGSLSTFVDDLKRNLERINLVPNSSDFSFSLSVNLDQTVDKNTDWIGAASQIVKAIGVSHCTVALSESISLEKIGPEISDWNNKLANANHAESPHVMLETPVISSGMELLQLTTLIENVAPEVGVLIRSNSTRYRFDLAIHDLQFALRRKKESENLKRDIAVRFQVGNSADRSASQIDFQREMFHRALVEQMAPQVKDLRKPDFISLESEQPLNWKRQENDASQVALGSRVFRDTISAFRGDLADRSQK